MNQSVECSISAHFFSGYNIVVRIPAGATNIDVRQHSFSGKSEDDNYLGEMGAPCRLQEFWFSGAVGRGYFLSPIAGGQLSDVMYFHKRKKLILKLIILFLPCTLHPQPIDLRVV